MFRDNIIESLKEMQLYKNVMSSTLNNELYSLHLASEDSFVPQLRSVYKELHADHETGAADNK